MSYSQAMKHWKNHRKDNHYQQCAPLITTNPSSKKDFSIMTPDGEYFITAYSYEHAKEIALAQGLNITERTQEDRKDRGIKI